MSNAEEARSSAGLARAVVIGFLALVCGIAAFDAASWLMHGPAPGGAQRAAPLDRDGLLRGGFTSATEHNLQNGSAFASRVRPLWNELRLRALGDGGRGVVVGRDGWLFLASDVRPPRDTARLQREYAAHAEAAALALRARGTETLLVVVPDKSTIEREMLPSGFIAPEPSYRALLDELVARGFDAPDLASWIANGPDAHWYRRDDTHWTLAGVERIALLLACRVRARVGLDAAPPPVLETRVSAWPAFRGIRPDLLSNTAISPGGAAWNEFVDPEHGRLIGVQRPSAPPRLALAGTSMSFKQLREQLCSELGVELANYAQAGAGSSGKLVELMLDVAAARTEAPQLVIWETVERYGREGPCLTFATLAPALDALYAAQWRAWADIEPSFTARRNLMTLARPPLEGEPLPQRIDAWDVRRFESAVVSASDSASGSTDRAAPPASGAAATHGHAAPMAAPRAAGVRFVLPANGTFALAFESAHNGVAMLAPSGSFENRQWTDAAAQSWSGANARLPIVGAEWLRDVELALRAGADAPAPSSWRLETAWRTAGARELRNIDAVQDVELAGTDGAEIAFDGTRALELEITSARDGTGRLRAHGAAAIDFPLVAGRARYVIPLRAGTEWNTATKDSATPTVANGFARARRVEIELPSDSRVDPRIIELSLRP